MELKAYTSNRIYWAVDERPADKEDALLVGEKFYLKSEADKVIAELKQEIERLKQENEMAFGPKEKGGVRCASIAT